MHENVGRDVHGMLLTRTSDTQIVCLYAQKTNLFIVYKLIKDSVLPYCYI